ncbi:peptide ABC transporter substrate-binding protein [Marinicella sediminis]|uniref:Peptide ABC transporter substrate-binding protein n=1 Tax=Marinicella sediminis TaxID=1792834 RepID=A0ABV7JEI7_9GAMM|nr:peptide ABC transporter substrate-binding protein [Marinicella sediminis]
MKILFCYLLCLGTQILWAATETLNRGNGGEPDSLDIHQAQGINSHNLLMDLYEGLMTFDAHGQVVTGVASQHSVSADQLTWHFTLKSDAKWSDGQPVTAHDFLYAWQRATDPAVAAPYRHLFEPLMQDNQLNVKVLNPHELVLTLSRPDSSLLNQLVLPVFYPLPSHQPEGKVSNGAYVLADWRLQEYIELHKNSFFHDAQDVYFSHVRYWVTENQNSELLRFRAGELDITETIPDNQTAWLKQHLANELRLAPYFGTFFLGLNLQDAQLKSKSLRQALNLAIDRHILVDKVLRSGQLPAQSIIPPQQAQPMGNFDPEKARKLLAESGFKAQSEQLEIIYNNSDNQKKVALAVAAMWRQNLNIRTRLRSQEWKVFVNTRKGPNKQIFRSGWIADYLDPVDFLNLFHSASRFNFYAFSNSGYDQILSTLNQTQDSLERVRLINEAEDILAEELPVIPLYHYVSRHLVSQETGGFHDNHMDKHLSRYLYRQNQSKFSPN